MLPKGCRHFALPSMSLVFLHLKKFTCKWTLRQMFICLRLRTPNPPPPSITQCIRVYSILIHTGKGEGGDEPERRGEG